MVVVLGIPLIFRPKQEVTISSDAPRLVIITPHNEQIRFEFERAFSKWRRSRGEAPVFIDWRVPGGTSEIRKILSDQYSKAISTGRITPEGELAPGAEPMPFDLFFGGGTYEHSEMKTGVTARVPAAPGEREGREVRMPMSIPMGFEGDELEGWFGKDNKIGSGYLYEPEQYWLGTALSGFGIVFNRDILRELGLPDPITWTDMTDPKLAGWVAMADPRMSGSVATTYDSILNNFGWKKGWRILRGMSANSITFTNNSTKVPVDVSQGEAAMGVSIDFYGRYQAQAVMRSDETPETSRVGYIDPPGVVYIDADPITLMRATTNPELAREFVKFTLSDEAQSLWQLRAHNKLRDAGREVPADGLGPERYELRRMPVRRDLYQLHEQRMIDKVDPFAAASTVKEQGWRSAIGPMMGAFAIDIHYDISQAWKAMRRARENGAPEEVLNEMERLFYAFPTHTMADGRELVFNEANYRAIKSEWDKGGQDGRPTRSAMLTEYTRFFRANYREIVKMAKPYR